MKVAALDLGTNSFLCLVADVSSGRVQKIHSDQVQIVRLGQEVNKTRMFHPEALKRARQCLQLFQKTIEREKPERVLAMATSAARDVANCDDLFAIGRELGIPIEIIPGDREAEITYSGAISGFNNDSRTRGVIDIGGGSTEVILGCDGRISFGRSADIGAVRLTEMFFGRQPPDARDVERAEKHIDEALAPIARELEKSNLDQLVAVAGTPNELMSAEMGGFDPARIDGSILSAAKLESWRNQFLATSPKERVHRLGISEGRADVILAGTMILLRALHIMKIDQVTVSTRGLRFGVALELAQRSE